MLWRPAAASMCFGKTSDRRRAHSSVSVDSKGFEEPEAPTPLGVAHCPLHEPTHPSPFDQRIVRTADVMPTISLWGQRLPPAVRTSTEGTLTTWKSGTPKSTCLVHFIKQFTAAMERYRTPFPHSSASPEVWLCLGLPVTRRTRSRLFPGTG